jgi:protein-disulfide isomerase
MPKENIRRRRARNLTRSIWLIAGTAVGSVVLLIAFGSRPLPTVNIPTSPPRPYATEGKTLGAADAPIVMEEYADFQCPRCGEFANGAARQIEEIYVATGKVKFVYHYFAFLGAESVQAAEAAECAGEQGHLWSYMDTLYLNQRGENEGAFDKAHLEAFAEGLGLDRLKFRTCLDTHRYRALVQSETQAGRARGVQGTPTFFLNGQMLVGALPFEEFRHQIEITLGTGT